MTIQNRCDAVEALLTTLESAKRDQTLADALNNRISELEEVDVPFHAVLKSLRTLREGAILTDSKLPDSSKAADRITAMREQLATAPQDVTKGQSFNLLCRAIKTVTEQSNVVTTTAWIEYVKTQAPVVDRTLLDQHRDSPRHSNAVVEIERLVQELKVAVKAPPQDSAALQSIKERWARIGHLLGTMPVTDDPEVQAFLNAAVSSDGAALTLFTSAVKKWLADNSMISDFCIRRSK